MHKPKPLRANLRVCKELRELITHMLAKKPKNRPTAREIADMLYCEIAVRPPMQRSLQPRVHGIGGAALARRVQLNNVDSTICAQLDTQVNAPPAPRWACAALLGMRTTGRLCGRRRSSGCRATGRRCCGRSA